MVKPTLNEIKSSELYALAEKTWLKPADKRQPDVDVIVTQIYQLIRPGITKESQICALDSLQYLHYLEKYAAVFFFFFFFFVCLNINRLY